MGYARHRLVEELSSRRVLSEIVEDAHPVEVIKGRLASLYAVEHLGPGGVITPFHERKCSHGVGRPASQELSQFGKREVLRARLGEDPDTRKSPQQAV